MLTARNSSIKPKDLILALLEAVQLLTQVAVIHCKGHQKDGSFISQGNNKADQATKQAVQSQEPDQSMALVIGPPELPGLPQYSPQEQENAEKWGYRKESTGWYIKDDKFLIPGAQERRLIKVLHGATPCGRNTLWDVIQRTFSGKGLEGTIKRVTLACDLCAHNNPQAHPIPPSLLKPLQPRGTYLGED